MQQQRVKHAAPRKNAAAATAAVEDDEQDDETDSSSSGDEEGDGSGRSKYDIFTDPLSLIDKGADFDRVLKAKSIGDAISLLCPNIPGLPSKTRGKYLKRKYLTDEEKAELQRERNRDNARRTRKRKKLYMAYIDKVLGELERKVGDYVGVDEGEDGDDDGIDDGMDIDEDGIDVEGLDADLALSLAAGAGESAETGAASESVDTLCEGAMLVRRLEFVQGFLKLRFAFPGEDEARRISDWLHICHGDAAYVAVGGAAVFLAPPCQGVAALELASASLARYFDGLEAAHRQGPVGWKPAQRVPTWFVRCELQLADAILDSDGSRLCVSYAVQLLCQDSGQEQRHGHGHRHAVATAAAAQMPLRAPLLLSRAHKEDTTGTAAATGLGLSSHAHAAAHTCAPALPDYDYDSSIESGDDDDGLDALDYYQCFDLLQSERSGHSLSGPSPQNSLRLSGTDARNGGGAGGGGGGSGGTAADLATAMSELRGAAASAPIEDWIASMLEVGGREPDGGGGEVKRRASIRSTGSVVSSISGAPFRAMAPHGIPGLDPAPRVGLGLCHNSDDWTHRATADALPFIPMPMPIPAAAAAAAAAAAEASTALMSAGAPAPGADQPRLLLAWNAVAHVEFAAVAGALRISRVSEYIEVLPLPPPPPGC